MKLNTYALAYRQMSKECQASMVAQAKIRINKERGRELASHLLRALVTVGIHGEKGMPEDLTPSGVKRGSLDHLLFVSLTVSIDYLRDASKLWKSARETYKDPETRYLFDPKTLHEASIGKVSRDMRRHALSKRPKKDSCIWRTVETTFYKKWGGNPRNFLENCEWDALKVLKRLRSDTHQRRGRPVSDYPYLRGPKIGPLWLRMLRDNVGLSKLKNLDKVPIPVDRHVARATLTTGVVRGIFKGNLEDLFEKIRVAWFRSVRGLRVKNRPMVALDVDKPLWLLSKHGCAERDEVTGDCPSKCSCEAQDFCIKGKIIVREDEALVET